MYAPLLAVAACGLPQPSDLLRADVLLTAPVGTPDESDGSPRQRPAILWVMRRDGAVDPDVEYQWFGPTFTFQSELDHARKLVQAARLAPPLRDDWLPPRDWFKDVSAILHARAVRLDADAATYRDWAVWNPDRMELYFAAARHAEHTADAVRCHAHRFAEWGVGGWAKPRRVVLAECKAWMGNAAWGRREFPAW